MVGRRWGRGEWGCAGGGGVGRAGARIQSQCQRTHNSGVCAACRQECKQDVGGSWVGCAYARGGLKSGPCGPGAAEHSAREHAGRAHAQPGGTCRGSQRVARSRKWSDRAEYAALRPLLRSCTACVPSLGPLCSHLFSYVNSPLLSSPQHPPPPPPQGDGCPGHQPPQLVHGQEDHRGQRNTHEQGGEGAAGACVCVCVCIDVFTCHTYQQGGGREG